MEQLIIYIHGKGGNADEAAHYRSLIKKSDVIGFDYKAENPWDARAEFSHFYDEQSKKYDKVVIIANSIGAFFAMQALFDRDITKGLFISPIADMERLILDMMQQAEVTEEKLKAEKEIATHLGETLSWEYLCYVREHPITWSIPTYILYGGKDCLTRKETVTDFSKQIGAQLTVDENAEHWFHTDEQMKTLDRWVTEVLGEKLPCG